MRLSRSPFQSRIRKITILILGLCLAWTGLAVCPVRAQEGSAQQNSQSTQRLPLDPMDREERAVAEHIARTDERVEKLLGESGVRLIDIQLTAVKLESPKEGERPVRHAEVVLFRLEGEVGARVLVNLQSRLVEQVARLSSNQVPMTNEDLEEARELALRDEELRRAVPEAQTYRVQAITESGTVQRAENAVSGLPIRGTKADDPCSKHRCLQLFFRKGRNFLSEPTVIVDLTAKRVYLERRKSK